VVLEKSMILSKLSEMKKKAKYVKSFLSGRLVHTNLQLLYDCNFKCRICDFHTPKYKDHPRLSVEQVRILGQKLALIGPQIISIGGGEPLLHPDLVEIVDILSADHFPVMICNGWFITRENARALFKAGIHEVSISVDYADPSLHDEQRGVKGAFDRAIEALRILDEARQFPWQRVHMITVVMEDNLDEIEKLLKMCVDMRLTYLVTLYSNSRGRLPAINQQKNVTDKLLSLKERYPNFVQLRGYLSRFSPAVDEGGVGPCYAGKHLCNIDSQGNVTLCIDRLDEPVGNLLEEEASTIQKRLADAWRDNDCRSCWTSCRGAIETLRYGGNKFGNMLDYYQMTKPVPLLTR